VLVKEMKSLCLNIVLEGHDLPSENGEEELDVDQALYEALAADAKKTEDETASAIDDIAAELGELMSDVSTDTDINELIGEGEEA